MVRTKNQRVKEITTITQSVSIKKTINTKYISLNFLLSDEISQFVKPLKQKQPREEE